MDKLHPQRAFDFFSLGSVTELQPISTGYNNANFWASNHHGERFVLRYIKNYNLRILENELSAQTDLRKHGLLTNFMLPSPEGNHAYCDGRLAVTVSRRIAGRHVSPGQFTPLMCFQVGLALGRFHRAVRSVPHSAARRILDPAAIQSELDHAEESQLKRTVEDLCKSASFSDTEINLPHGVCHGDLYVNNILFTEDDQIALLDLESVSDDVFLLDMARSIIDVCRCDDRLDRACVHRFIDGYSQIRKLTTAESGCLPKALAYAASAVAAWMLARNRLGLAEHFAQAGIKALLSS